MIYTRRFLRLNSSWLWHLQRELGADLFYMNSSWLWHLQRELGACREFIIIILLNFSYNYIYDNVLFIPLMLF